MSNKERDREREEQESTEFKVTDRRLFTAEGELRTDLEPEKSPEEPPKKPKAEAPKPKPEAAPPKERPAQAPPAQPKAVHDEPKAVHTEPKAVNDEPAQPGSEQPGAGRPQGRPGERGPVSFEHLVMSLATTAMFQLGLVKNPEDPNPPVDLAAARETITLLEILKEKTKGNLTPDEETLLEGSLYELHMVFVELTKAAARSRFDAR